jgi:hypothetical protein
MTQPKHLEFGGVLLGLSHSCQFMQQGYMTPPPMDLTPRSSYLVVYPHGFIPTGSSKIPAELWLRKWWAAYDQPIEYPRHASDSSNKSGD